MIENNALSDRVTTIDTSFDILETLLSAGGMSVTELADELGIAKSTVHRHITTLHGRQYVIKEGDIYHISAQFLEFGEHVQSRKEGYRLAEEKVTELAEETSERAQFLIEEHGLAVYLYRRMGSKAVRTDPGIGKRIPLHTISAGKVILAHMPEDQVSYIFEQHGLKASTEHTITDREQLFKEFEEIRQQGYGVNNQENVNGLRAIAAPVKNENGQILGALSISGPIHRMKGDWFEIELPNLLLGTVNEIELNITYG